MVVRRSRVRFPSAAFHLIRTGKFHIVAAVAQSVERRIGSAEVTGPIPVSSLEKGGSFWNAKGFCFFVFVIQLKSAAINLGR